MGRVCGDDSQTSSKDENWFIVLEGEILDSPFTSITLVFLTYRA